MPTVCPSSHPASNWGTRPDHRSRHKHLPTTPEQLLTAITTDESSSPRSHPLPRLVGTSFTNLTSPSPLLPLKNGFVHATLEAYNEHHNLVLRPDDIWLAIITQLSAHINANSASLRAHFVSHYGQQPLHLEVNLTADLDHGAMAYEMTKHMSTLLNDPSLREWILPGFTTTEKSDQAVAAVVLLGAMQKYFSYSWGTRCGIPAVTLLGEEDDWMEIAERAARIGKGDFGPEAARWYRVLRPVLAGFVETFREPEGEKAKRFWKGVVDEHRPNGSGCVTYSGWITAFCFWDEKGVCLHEGRGTVRLARNQIPSGFARVPVTLLDMGREIRTEMVAGSVGMRIRRWEEEGAEGKGGEVEGQRRWEGFDTLQPESGWFMQFVS